MASNSPLSCFGKSDLIPLIRAHPKAIKTAPCHHQTNQKAQAHTEPLVASQQRYG